jgi:hypothetical protein
MAAVPISRTSTALGAFQRRLSARVGKSKALIATARKLPFFIIRPSDTAWNSKSREPWLTSKHPRSDKCVGLSDVPERLVTSLLQPGDWPSSLMAVGVS